MRSPTLTKLSILITFAAIAVACGPDKEVPEAPGGEGNQQEANSGTTANGQRQSDGQGDVAGLGEYAGWGAHAGTTATLAALADCNSKGFYFDRAAENGAGKCDETQKVPGNCNTFDLVKQLTKINETQIENIENELAEGGHLDGFLFDQCVDAGTKFYVWLVRQSDDGTIGIKRVNVEKPA